MSLWMGRSTYCAIIICITIIVLHNTNGEIVTIPNLGTIVGSTTKTARTQSLIYQFLGVRYAESPSGAYRFKVGRRCGCIYRTTAIYKKINILK